MLYYEEYGNAQGKPVIFIHGGFTSHKMYEKQFDILPEFRKIFVDLPNCGKSQGYDRFTFDAAVDGVRELMDRLVPGQNVFLVGHSYGGLVVKGLLESVPERIERVVIGSTNLKKSRMYRLYTSSLGTVLTWGKNWRSFRREKISLKLIYETQKSAWKHFELPQGRPVKNPVLLLYADGDIADIQDSMQIWKKCLPYAEMRMFSGAGHGFFREHPELVNPVVEEFMRK